jgi:hypothetical protein
LFWDISRAFSLMTLKEKWKEAVPYTANGALKRNASVEVI